MEYALYYLRWGVWHAYLTKRTMEAAEADAAYLLSVSGVVSTRIIPYKIGTALPPIPVL